MTPMTTLFECRAIGLPAPQGSKRHVGRGVMIESSKKLKPWRQSVVYAATEATGGKALRLDSAMALHVEFLMPRPKKPKSLWPCRTPDLSKLVRGVEDALQDAGVITDDARFVDIVATKRYVLGHSQAGAMITIYKLHVD